MSRISVLGFVSLCPGCWKELLITIMLHTVISRRGYDRFSSFSSHNHPHLSSAWPSQVPFPAPSQCSHPSLSLSFSEPVILSLSVCTSLQTPLLNPPLHSFAFLSARSWIISTWQPSRPCLFSFPSKRTSNLGKKRADDHWLLTFSASI